MPVRLSPSRFCSARSAPCSLLVDRATADVSGLVAAYGFDEGSGPTALDASPSHASGTVSGAAWNTAGRHGSALSFDGTNDSVAISSTAALDLTTGMTLEAWVRPTSLGGWRTVILKERPGNLSYALYASDGNAHPSSYVTVGGAERSVTAPSALPLNTWTHLASTYDGTTIRVFVNGVQAAASAATGSITASTSPLKIGGNSVWGEWFAGLIDEVRVYNRALDAGRDPGRHDDPGGSWTAAPPPPPPPPNAATVGRWSRAGRAQAGGGHHGPAPHRQDPDVPRHERRWLVGDACTTRPRGSQGGPGAVQPLLLRHHPARRRPDHHRRRPRQPERRLPASPGRSIFDPATETWTETPPMSQRRWYPSATTLPDGRVLVTSGCDGRPRRTSPTSRRSTTPRRTRGRNSPSARLAFPFYPFSFRPARRRDPDRRRRRASRADPDTRPAPPAVDDARARAPRRRQRGDVLAPAR